MGYTNNRWLLNQCVRTVKKRNNKLANNAMIITTYRNLEELYANNKDVTGSDKICTFKVTSELSPYYGKSIVTTCSDILESLGGGFITYAEKFLFAKDASKLIDARNSTQELLRFMRNEEHIGILLEAYRKSVIQFVSAADASRGTTKSFAFDLDNFDIVYYGILKRWFDPI